MSIRLSLAAAVCALALLAGAGFSTACASGGGRVTPASAYNDDAAITARVKTALLNDTQINATKIEVATSGGVVTLIGSVKSQGEADRAVQLTRSAAGVKDVKSELHIGS